MVGIILPNGAFYVNYLLTSDIIWTIVRKSTQGTGRKIMQASSLSKAQRALLAKMTHIDNVFHAGDVVTIDHPSFAGRRFQVMGSERMYDGHLYTLREKLDRYQLSRDTHTVGSEVVIGAHSPEAKAHNAWAAHAQRLTLRAGGRFEDGRKVR